jgi:hypothetical protein
MTKISFIIRKKNLFLLLLLVVFYFSLGYAQINEWTVMVYMAADNDLEPDGISDFNEMEAIGSTGDVDILVQFDRSTGYDDTNGDWTDTKRFRVEKDDNNTTISTKPLQEMGEVNMGDTAALTSFIKWAVDNYPAKHYALVLWNHGGGWRKSNGVEKQHYKDVCFDETDNDYLSNFEVTEAIKRSKANIDILAYDACLMGMMEVAYQVRDNASFMVASEDGIPLDGYDYKAILNHLTGYPSIEPDSLSKVLVKTFIDYPGYEFESVALSAIDLTKMNILTQKMDTMVAAIIEDNTLWDQIYFCAFNMTRFLGEPHVDIVDLSKRIFNKTTNEKVKTAIDTFIKTYSDAAIANEWKGSYTDLYGLSIYFPNPTNYDTLYSSIDNENTFPDSTLWDEFIAEYFAKTNSFLEPNNLPATAYNLYGNPDTITSKIKDPLDIDYFRFFHNDRATQTLSCFSKEKCMFRLIYIKDTVISVLDTVYSDDNTPYFILDNQKEKGCYYVSVTSDEEDGVNYSLNLDINPLPYFSNEEIIFVYEDGTPQVSYAPEEGHEGIGLFINELKYLKGLWYYITELNVNPQNDKPASFSLLVKDPDRNIIVTPEKTGWNYLDLRKYDIFLNKSIVGFEWTDNENKPAIGLDSTYADGCLYNFNGTWEQSEDSLTFFIRPVISLDGPNNDTTCYCDEITKLTDLTGSISDNSGNNYYKNEANCKWLIQPTGATDITITFKEFVTEAGYDSVTVYDGADSLAPILASLSGYIEKDTSVTSTNGTMFIQFLTDDYYSCWGWSATYNSRNILLEDEKEYLTYRAYPNPGDGRIKLDLNSKMQEKVTVKVVSVSGSVVYLHDFVGEKTVSMDISNNPAGLYFIEIYNKSNIERKTYVLQ